MTLAEAYTAGGEVLMGTLRWEKERAGAAERELRRAEAEHKRCELEASEAEIVSRLEVLKHELEAKRAELHSLRVEQEAQEDGGARSKRAWAHCAAWTRRLEMTPRNTADAETNPRKSKTILFRLYIANEAPSSAQAIANLRSICQEYLPDHHEIEVVDILREPLRALLEGILVTPTLVRLSPPVRHIVGDLSDRAIVLRALGLEGKAK